MQEFQKKINELSEKIQNDKKFNDRGEEAIKQYYITPFLSILGYDTRNPDEVEPEFDTKSKDKGKDTKVDYVVLRDEFPLMLVEAKSPKVSLDDCVNQLRLYFSGVVSSYSKHNALLAILTNGAEYRFFADTKKPNVMDETAFYVANLCNLTSDDIKFLKMLEKGVIDIEKIKEFAIKSREIQAIKKMILREFESPSDEFAKLFFKEICNDNFQGKIKESFKDTMKQAFCGYVQEKSVQNGDENLETSENSKVNLNTFEKQSTQKSVTLNDEWKSLKPRCVKFPNGNQESVSSVREAVKVIIKYLKNNHAIKLERAIKENNFAFIHFGEVEQKATLVIMDFGSFKFAYNSSATSLRSATKKLVEACDLEPSEFEVITI